MDNMNMNNTKAPYLTLATGTNKAGKFVVYHGEGFLTSDPFYRPADGEKAPFLSLNVSVGRNPWSILGEADSHPEGEDKRFSQLILTGDLAEQYKFLQKGTKVAFTGNAQRYGWKTKEGVDAESVRILVKSLAAISTKRFPDVGKATTGYAWESNVYTSHGEEHTEYRVCLLTGTVKTVDAPRQVGASEVTNVAVELEVPAAEVESKVNGRKDTQADGNKTVRVAFWNKKSTAAAKILRPGAIVALTGTMTSKENGNGGVYVNMNAREFSVIKYPDVPDTAAAAPAAPVSDPVDMGVEASVSMDDNDMDALPF